MGKLSKLFDVTVRAFDEKLPPYASVHTVAQTILSEDRENQVFAQDEQCVESPEILLFISDEVDDELFFRKLEKTIRWHGFRLEWMDRAKKIFVVGNNNVEYKVKVYNILDKKTVTKKIPYCMEIL